MNDEDLNALVAENVMGWHRAKDFPGCPYLYDDVGRCRWTPGDHDQCYSTDIAAAWNVVEKMKDRQWTFSLCSLIKNRWRAEFGGSRKRTHIWADADNAPRAICLAALASIHVKIS